MHFPCSGRRALLAALLLVLLPGQAGAREFEGPLQVRNQFPILLPLAPPYLESAEVRNRVIAGLSHSSIYVIESSPVWVVNMDLELTELDLRFTRKTGSSTELGLDIPFIRLTAGFLDQPLAWFHEVLGTGDYGRSERPHNEFLYQVDYQGQPVIKPESGRSGIGDVRATVKRQIRAASPAVSIMADVEFPTGDAKTGYGNGSYDFGIALLMDVDLGERYRGSVNLGFLSPGDLKGYQTIPLRNVVFAGLGIEAAWWERFHAIAQVMVQQSPYPETGIREVDWPGILLMIGGRYVFERSALEFSLTEDPNTAGAPDFTLNVGYAWNY
jgi:hypothetical protein